MGIPWQLKLVDASPGVDRAAWQFEDTFLSRSGDRYSIHSPGRFEMYMEPKR
jgi:hypothetical protein